MAQYLTDDEILALLNDSDVEIPDDSDEDPDWAPDTVEGRIGGQADNNLEVCYFLIPGGKYFLFIQIINETTCFPGY